MIDRLLRRLGQPGRDQRVAGDPPWDRPADDRFASAASDMHAGGAAWDRPSDEEFAPPVERDLHWAFRSPSGDAPPAAGPGPEDGVPDHWAYGELGADALDPGLTLEDGARLVTAGRSQLPAAPRDPAQPGMFDPYDAFAPVVEEPWWGEPPPPQRAFPEPPAGAVPPAPTSPAPERPPGTIGRPEGPPGATPRARSEAASVFGDFFAGGETGAGGQQLSEFASQSAPAGGGPPMPRLDPVEWPPIPTDLLPAMPESLPLPAAEPDGRRFTWPPPQPRLTVPAFDDADTAAPAESPDQETLWTSEARARDTPATDGIDSGSRSFGHPFEPFEPSRFAELVSAGPAAGEAMTAGTPAVNNSFLAVVATVLGLLALALILSRLLGLPFV